MADDPELARWRAQRLAQMQGAAGGARSPQEAEQMRKKEEEMAEQRRLMLKQILSDAASERLNNVRLVKPDKATQVESYIINLAQSGRLTGKLSGEQLKDLLHQVAEQTGTTTKVTIARRRQAFDDEDDDDDEGF